MKQLSLLHESRSGAVEAEQDCRAFFDLHVKNRMLCGIGVLGGSNSLKVKNIDRVVFEIQVSTRNPWIYPEMQGLVDLLLEASGIGSATLEDNFPKSKSYYRDGEFYPWGSLIKQTLSLALECLMLGHIFAVCESGGLVSIIPIECLASNHSSDSALLNYLHSQKGLRFMSYENLHSREELLSSPGANVGSAVGASVAFPSYKGAAASELKKRSKDHKFVVEGVELVKAGEAQSANHAADLLLSRHGWACRGAKDSKGKIIAASDDAAKTRLRKQISNELRLLSNI